MAYLHDRHRRMLIEESGISAEVIAQRGYRSVDDPVELIRLGFAPSQARAGLLIPQWTTAGVQRGYMLRPDQPRTNEHDKPLKYEVPAGSSPMIDCPPAMATKLRDPSVPLYITEGSKKADTAATHGLTCVSLAGVYGFLQHKLVIADLDDIHLAGRRVILAFDSDVTTKPEVADARNRLGSACWRRGATVEVVTLPPGPNGTKVGLDDFLAAGNTVANLDTRTTSWHHEVIEVPEIAQLRAERDHLVRDLAALFRLVLNPHVKRAELMTYVATYHEMRNATPEEPGGPVALSAGEIAHDFRPKPTLGEHVAPTNKDGSHPRLARAQVKSILTSAMERGLLTFDERPAMRSRQGRPSYRDREYVFTPPASLADWIGPAAAWSPDEPKLRRPRRIFDPCRYCGEVHPIERVDTCTGCGSIVDLKYIVPEPIDAMGDNLSPIADGSMSSASPAVVAPSSPPPSNGIGDKSSPIDTREGPDRLTNAPDPEEEASTGLARRRTVADAHPLLAAADEATDPSEFKHATEELSTVLEASARARGRAPVPKPTAPPMQDRWDTLPPPGARP